MGTVRKKKLLLLIFAISLIQNFGTLNCEKWEDISIVCPSECACQYLPFDDLSVASWVQGVEKNVGNSSRLEKIVSNEAIDFESTESSESSGVKSATCLLRENSNAGDFILSLPQDLEVLVLFYSGGSKNLTIHTSEISVLTDISTLEIRGTPTSNLIIVFDEPLVNVKYVNFEAVTLHGVEKVQRRPNYQTFKPSDHFDYIPESEKVSYNTTQLVIEEKEQEEVEIVPYEVYILEKQKAKSVTFYGWKTLEILRIHECSLNELYWEFFDGLDSLEQLSLEHNNIKVIQPFTFFGANHIKTLSLARNNILDLNYRAFAGLLDLKELDLSYNNITKLSELSFPPFPNLEVMDLRQNPIRYIFPATFGVMNGTKTVYFGSFETALDLNTEDNFEHLLNLRELVVLNATAEAITAATLRGLDRLEKLTLRGELNRIEFDAFAGKPYLKELSLRECQIEEVSMDTLFGITNLEIIDLSFNKLSTIPQGLFDEQHQLREIYLQNNNLKELSHNFFDLPALKLVQLNNNPWVCNCEMASWKQAVTNVIKVEKFKTLATCEADSKHCSTQQVKEVEYVYSNQLIPRCNGSPEPIQGRSLYYAIRRDLRCNLKKHRQKADKKRQSKKDRIAQKSAEYYANQVSELRWHNAPPTRAKLEPYDYQKSLRKKEMHRKFNLKMYNSIMRDYDKDTSNLLKYQVDENVVK